MYVDHTCVTTEKLYGREQEEGWVFGLSNRMTKMYDFIWFGSEKPGAVVTYPDLCRKFKGWDSDTILYCLIGLCESDYIKFACFKDGKRGYVKNGGRGVILNPVRGFADAYRKAKQGFEDGIYEPEDWTEE